ncbi:MAG TPA: aminotransferase, partial [bacterium]|nr:aminotransferase [bacterium]
VIPRGAYYIMTEFGALSAADDVTFAHSLVKDVGVATVPGSSFYHDPAMGRRFIRFAYPKKEETLSEVARRLAKLRTTAKLKS